MKKAFLVAELKSFQTAAAQAVAEYTAWKAEHERIVAMLQTLAAQSARHTELLELYAAGEDFGEEWKNGPADENGDQ